MTRSALRVALLATALLPCLLVAEEPAKRVDVSEDFSAILDGGAIAVEVRPLEGETIADFARRISRDEGAAARLLALATPPSRTRTILLPYAGLSDETRLAAGRALFPSDARATIGWLHVAVGSEPLSSIASWFTGDERLAARLGEINGLADPVIARGTLVKVPVEYLLPPFRDAEPIPDEEPPRLEYGSDEKGKFAIYRLKRKEALYSAVVVRFTGRLHAEDVIQLALDIALRSGIDDVHGIPVGFPVKIPLELLSEEFLPPDDPKIAAREKERAEAALFATPAKARGLAGVRVVIDAGHGGRDTGTLHHSVWESTYVYDVASRLRKVLLATTRAEVGSRLGGPACRPAPGREDPHSPDRPPLPVGRPGRGRQPPLVSRECDPEAARPWRKADPARADRLPLHSRGFPPPVRARRHGVRAGREIPPGELRARDAVLPELPGGAR